MKFRKKSDPPYAKAALKTAQSGTPVAEKDTSSTKTQAKASAGPSKGSMMLAKSLPTENASSQPVSKYENSYEDMKSDYVGAKRKGITPQEWENSASDRISDKAGEKNMRDAEAVKPKADSSYTPGKPAFQNSPKMAHGFRHTESQKDGHLRNSGHSNAHRIGRK